MFKPKIKAIIADVDGTLTINREDYRLEIEAIKAIRKAEEQGIPVILISGNALPIVVSISRYIGTTGPVIGENGCLIFYKGKILNVATFSAKDAVKAVLEKFGNYIEPSWQNVYRVFDFAFKVKKNFRNKVDFIVSGIQKFLEIKGFNNIFVTFSGYALHLTPTSGGKDKGLLKALKLIGLRKDEVICVGDGLNDIDLFRICPYSATVLNADEELKKLATYVASKPSGKGFAETVEHILSSNNI
ncbi:MAG: phosphoglycolate phosphatase [Thermoprotei archaeon]|nr:MAG: phosphoglycolate phosphatase [Thermoprotei archaeon]